MVTLIHIQPQRIGGSLLLFLPSFGDPTELLHSLRKICKDLCGGEDAWTLPSLFCVGHHEAAARLGAWRQAQESHMVCKESSDTHKSSSFYFIICSLLTYLRITKGVAMKLGWLDSNCLRSSEERQGAIIITEQLLILLKSIYQEE